jgi:hypothetical protein
MSHTRLITIRTSNPLLVDRGLASIVRQQYLDRYVDEDPNKEIVIDLNGIRGMSVQAADELLGTWIERRRRKGNGPIFIRGRLDLLRVVNAALRDGQLNAIALSPEDNRAVAIGEFSKAQLDLLRVLPNQGVTAAAAGALVPDGAGDAVTVLDQLIHRGVLAKDGDVYRVPQPTEVEAAIPA